MVVYTPSRQGLARLTSPPGEGGVAGAKWMPVHTSFPEALKLTDWWEGKMVEKIEKTEEEWRQELTPQEYHVLRGAGTEAPFTGKYYKFKGQGAYLCAACGEELFSSGTKYESGSGWPSFWAPASAEKVEEKRDTSHGMIRTEVKCSRCGSHLGHLFEDGPRPTGLRYCINSAALDFAPEEEA
jgi:peptide-methionine (R)-S-oxide reductase